MRWAALVLLAVAIGVISFGMMSPWVAVSGADAPFGARGFTVDMGFASQFPGVVWVFDTIGLAGIAFVMVKRNELPKTGSLVVGVASIVGAAAMGWTISTLRGAEATVAAGYQVPTHLASGAWIALGGFIAAAVASGGLWLLTRRPPSAAA